jgi:DNA-binding IclR family transcriptional regulator
LASCTWIRSSLFEVPSLTGTKKSHRGTARMVKSALRAKRPHAEENQPEPGYHTRALVRALAILDTFSAERRPLAVKDLHLLLDLPKPTVSRLAAVLERFGYLIRREQTFMLGPKLFELGSLFARQDGLVEISRRPLEQLSADSRQTSCLGVLLPPDIVHVVVVPSASPVHYVTKVGSLAPAHSTGLGKALLGGLSPEAFEGVLPELRLSKYTANTIIEPDRLRREIALTRTRGYSVDDEETAPGLKCVAVAVDLPPVGPVAVSLSGPAAEFTKVTMPAFAERLHRTVAHLRQSFTSAADYMSPADPAAEGRLTASRRSGRSKVIGAVRG